MEKTSCSGLKIGQLFQTWLDFQKKYTNTSSGYVLTDVGAQSHIAVAGLETFSPVTPPPSTPPADQKVSVYAHNAPVI